MHRVMQGRETMINNCQG